MTRPSKSPAASVQNKTRLVFAAHIDPYRPNLLSAAARGALLLKIRKSSIRNKLHQHHLIGLDEQGTIVLREKLARSRIARRLAKSIGPRSGANDPT